ncbi:MAG: hypothetical protein ACI31D_04600, partial [Candidatus Limisoma sp.]
MTKNTKAISFFFQLCMAIVLLATTTSCDKESSYYEEPDMPAKPTLSAPKLDKYLTTSDYSTVSLRARFTNGGDVSENMTCKVHWRKYSTKPSKTPKASDMTEHETMRQYGGGTSTKTTFDKSHAGISGGTYIY